MTIIVAECEKIFAKFVSMKTAVITVRDRSTAIQYEVVDHAGLFYAWVEWQSGAKTFFYKGMYGISDRWENRYMPDDLILAVSEVFNKEIPVKAVVIDHWSVASGK
jgi:hypothetical protein